MHILQCPQAKASAACDKALTQVQDWKQEQLDPQLIHLLITRLQAWRDGEAFTSTALVAQKQCLAGIQHWMAGSV